MLLIGLTVQMDHNMSHQVRPALILFPHQTDLKRKGLERNRKRKWNYLWNEFLNFFLKQMINSNVYLQLEFLTELILSSENKKVENIFIVKKGKCWSYYCNSVFKMRLKKFKKWTSLHTFMSSPFMVQKLSFTSRFASIKGCPIFTTRIKCFDQKKTFQN